MMDEVFPCPFCGREKPKGPTYQELVHVARQLVEQAMRAWENLDLTQGKLADGLLAAIEGVEAVIGAEETGVILPVTAPVSPGFEGESTGHPTGHPTGQLTGHP